MGDSYYQPRIAWRRHSTGIGLLALVGATLWPTHGRAAELTWLDYRGALGCPPRELFERELLSRASHRPTVPSEWLLVDIAFEDGAYLGHVRFRDGEVGTGRAVRSESCEQVVHALALVAALMLDTESHATAAAPAPEPMPKESATLPPTRTESTEVVTPPRTKPAIAAARPRAIDSLTLGPWFALTLDSLAAPSMRLGARVGALLTLHRLLPGTQQQARLSAAQIHSGTLTLSDTRQAEITWTSVRLDLCHGTSSQRLTSLGGCAYADVGRWFGQGWVAGEKHEQAMYWSRLGGTVEVRQGIVGGLALHAALGFAVALSRPEFYFAAYADQPPQSIHRPARVGPIADLGLELHFW